MNCKNENLALYLRRLRFVLVFRICTLQYSIAASSLLYILFSCLSKYANGESKLKLKQIGRSLLLPLPLQLNMEDCFFFIQLLTPGGFYWVSLPCYSVTWWIFWKKYPRHLNYSIYCLKTPRQCLLVVRSPSVPFTLIDAVPFSHKHHNNILFIRLHFKWI